MGNGASVSPDQGPQFFMPSKLVTSPLVIGKREKIELLLDQWKYSISKEVLEIGVVIMKSGIKKSLVGKKTSDTACFDLLHTTFVNTVLDNTTGLPPDYKYFGTHNNKLNLCTILKHNPLYGMHLTSMRDESGRLYFEIKTFNDHPKKRCNTSWYSQLIQSASFTFPNRILVNARFSSDLELTEIIPYDCKGNQLAGISESDCCGFLLNSIRLAAQLIHGLQHIHHCIMICAAYNAGVIDQKTELISKWIEQYCPQVMLKHVEVEAVLFNNSGILTANSKQQPVVMAVLTKMLRCWCSCTSAAEYNRDFVLSSLLKRSTEDELRGLGFFTEYFKHCDLIGPYASELYEAFKANDAAALDDVDDDIEKYLSMVDNRCKWKISNLNHWVQSMSVTGIMHGFVTGGTRLQMTAGVTGKDFLLGQTKKTFNNADYSAMILLAGTLAGLQPGKAVFSSSVVDSLPDERVKTVIKKYDTLSSDLKRDYFDKVRLRSDYNDLGFILNDGIVDQVDGRQLTLTTYV